MATRLKRVTGTGVVHTGKCWLKSIILTPAAAVSTLVVDDSTDGSATDLLSMQAAANGNSADWSSGDQEGVWFTTGIHATLGGAGAAATFEYEV